MKPDRVVIAFDSGLFDVETEPPNDVNPIRGHSFLAWLAPVLETGAYRVRGPFTEDWGWYLAVSGPAGRYIVGASALSPSSTIVDWTVQITRSRSLRERLRGAGRIGPADPLVRRIEATIREQVGATEVVVEVLDDRGRLMDGG